MCYLPESRNVITLVRRINFAYILLYTYFTILVSGSESSHSRVTRASYNYDLQSNGSFGHHFFHIKTRSSAEHSKLANRERFKWFSRIFRFLAFLCQTWYQEEQSDPCICSTKFHSHIHCIVYLVIGRSSQDS